MCYASARTCSDKLSKPDVGQPCIKVRLPRAVLPDEQLDCPFVCLAHLTAKQVALHFAVERDPLSFPGKVLASADPIAVVRNFDFLDKRGIAYCKPYTSSDARGDVSMQVWCI
jgi:hypothetical protein